MYGFTNIETVDRITVDAYNRIENGTYQNT